MTINLKLLTGEPLKADGYPLTFIIQHKGAKRKYKIGHCFPEHYIDSDNTISSRHPDYDGLYPIILDYKLKAREILRSRPEDVNKVYDDLFNKQSTTNTLFAFTALLNADLKGSADKLELLGDHEGANKIRGNVRVYNEAANQLQNYRPDVKFSEMDYSLVMGFRDFKTEKGNSKATIGVYMRSLRALYNKAARMYKFEDKKPFENALMGLVVRSSQTRKKHAGIEVVKKIEGIKHDYASMHLFTDLWLLQFYFAGADFINIYYLKNTDLKNGRVYFNRKKGNSAVLVDLVIHPKAQAIIDKYKVKGEYLFPWRKDTVGYETFRGNLYRRLQTIQKRFNIELEGHGGNLGIKMVRHTFGNIAKQKGIEEDLLRELMGHERDDVDNFYKDKYPQAVRDEALFKVIG